ncbi:MAG: hypothetical protein K0R65_870 [Crocinitomicaceae bacterium]|jgi:hypothetical protein|nr:hypothetical protein [Crocinitomicaceae bacterium]
MKALLSAILFNLLCLQLFAAFCNPGTSQGAITPTTVNQTTAAMGNGVRPYFTFPVQAGCEYTFSTCGSNNGVDTYIRIYDGVNGNFLIGNDDGAGCAGGASRLTFLANVTGNWVVFISRYQSFANQCANLSANIQLQYSRNCAHGTSECWGGTQICNDQTFTGNNDGPGDYQELNASNAGCLTNLFGSTEHQSSWYYFIPTANGNIDFTIETGVDYDFAVWSGPGVNCGALGLPIRCSYAADPGFTGLGNGALDPSEDAAGDRYVSTLNVNAGQFYILLIDNFTADNTPFTINFSFSAPNLLNCNPIPLPVTLFSFEGEHQSGGNKLSWLALNENNNAYYTLERSTDNLLWEFVTELESIPPDSKLNPKYEVFDQNFHRNQLNYYRLSQTDVDGNKTIFEDRIVVIDNTIDLTSPVKIVNMLGQEIQDEYKGWAIEIYSDGSTRKIFR